MRYLTACAIVRDEPDLPDWVAFHLAAGVEHLMIYDNGSTHPVAKLLEKHLAAGLVSVFEYGGKRPQLKVYQDAIQKCRVGLRASRWLACIDADEYLVPLSSNDMKAVLAGFEGEGALAVNWLLFGTSGHLVRQPWPVAAHYTRCELMLNHHVKCIVQPQRTIRPLRNPHQFLYSKNFRCIDENGAVVSGYSNPMREVRAAQINHYFIKSREDWTLKILRGHADGAPPRTMEELAHYEGLLNAGENRQALRFLRGMEQYW